MSVADMDLAPRRNPDQIRNRRFAKVRKGFDPDQVREFLAQVADTIEELDRELRDSRSDQAAGMAVRPEGGRDPYAEVGERLAEILRTAEREAGKVRREAEEEANRRMADARQNAERVLREAEVESERLLREGAERLRSAHTQAEAALAGVSSRKESLVTGLRDSSRRLSAMLTELEETLQRIEAAGRAPEVEEPAPFEDRFEEIFGETATLDEDDDDVDIELPEIPSLLDDPDDEP